MRAQGNWPRPCFVPKRALGSDGSWCAGSGASVSTVTINPAGGDGKKFVRGVLSRFLLRQIESANEAGEPDKYKPAMEHPLCVAAAVISVYALALATKALQSPEEKLMSQDQEAIDGCWRESRGSSLTSAQQQQEVIEACQRLEDA